MQVKHLQGTGPVLLVPPAVPARPKGLHWAGICVLHQLHQDWKRPPDLTWWLQCRGNGELLLGGKNNFCDIIVPWNAKETLFLNLPWSDALFTSLQEVVWWVHSFPPSALGRFDAHPSQAL